RLLQAHDRSTQYRRDVGMVASRDLAGSKVHPDVRRQEAECGKRAGVGWDDHRSDGESLGQFRRVKWAGAAEGDQHEFTWVVAAGAKRNPHGTLHRCIGDLNDARGRFLDLKIEWLCHPTNRVSRRVDVELQPATERLARIQPSEN